MKQKLLLSIGLLLGQIAFAQYNYPTSKTVDSADIYWGVKVPDPYRWLEDLKNPEVETWFKTQAEYTKTQLSKIPNQDKLVQELKDLDKLTSDYYLPPTKAGGKYFYNKRSPGDQAMKLYYRQGINGKEILLFDPQNFIKGKTMNYSENVSHDGSRVILNLSEEGAEIGDDHILDVATGKFLSDSIPRSRGGNFAGSSNTEIIYEQTPNYDVHDPNFQMNIPSKLHVLGKPASSDIVIASSKKNPEMLLPSEDPDVFVYNDCSFIFLSVGSVETNLTLYYAPKSQLKSDKINWKPLTVKADEVKQILPHGNDVYLLTSKGNSNYKIIKSNLGNPNLSDATVIAEGKDGWKIFNFFSQTKDYLVFNKTKNDLVAKVYTYAFETGKLSEINVPFKGNVYGGSISGDFFSKDDNEILLINSGWTFPPNFYTYNIETKASGEGFFHINYDYNGLQNIVYEEVEVPSYDGTLVPLSIVYDKTKLMKDGSNISLMQGYGAYGVTAYVPAFGKVLLPLLNRGVVMAFAHVRGGGEKGEEWHIGGMKTTKPNTWKDFNACAEFLVKNKYTSSEKLGAEAGSAGGILIGRAITERPDLYKVAILKVGVLNAVRFEFSPNGPSNTPEFGTVKDSIEFGGLLEMDAYQHIKKDVKYPAQLITTGWNDPRVASYFPAKFAARMQAESISNLPVFLDVSYNSGHSGGSTTDAKYIRIATEYAFLLWQCSDPEFQPIQGKKDAH